MQERELVPVFTHEEIGHRVTQLAAEISYWAAKEVQPIILLGVLKGSFIFFADLARAITAPLEIEFVVLSSYGNARESSGKVAMNFFPPRDDLDSRRILIVEDIVETGHTLHKLVSHLEAEGAKEVRICTLLDKPGSRATGNSIVPDYVGFTISETTYVVGYGLDDGQELRNLPSLFGIKK